MGKGSARADPNARRQGENYLQWTSRIARQKQETRDRSEPIVPVEAQRHGDYQDEFVTDVDTNTKVQTKRNQVSSIVDKWFREGGVGFDGGAKAAVERCVALWELRPVIGHLCATYGPLMPSGGFSGHESHMDLRDELDEFKSWFHPGHWAVYENVVRWGQPAGLAGSSMADNAPQAIASAKAVVGMVASFIAMRRGY